MSDMRLPPTAPQVRETVAPQTPTSQPMVDTNVTPESATTPTTPQSQDGYKSSFPKQVASSENDPVDERCNFAGSLAAAIGSVLAVLSGTNINLKPAQDQLDNASAFINKNGTSYNLGFLGNGEVNHELNHSTKQTEASIKMLKDQNKKPETENA